MRRLLKKSLWTKLKPNIDLRKQIMQILQIASVFDLKFSYSNLKKERHPPGNVGEGGCQLAPPPF